MNKPAKPVRLSDHDLHALKTCFKKHFLAADRLWLFGSRADLERKGGDIDLYIETHLPSAESAFKAKTAFLIEFTDLIGEQKIDLVLNIIYSPHPLPIHEIAITKGVRII